MLFSAQRVLTPYGAQGVNAYRYVHVTTSEWPFADPKSMLGEVPLQLEQHHLVVPPGGNRVRSYVEIAAPPGVSVAAVSACVHLLAAEEAPPSEPIEFPAYGCAIRYVAETELGLAWPADFLDLAARALLTG